MNKRTLRIVGAAVGAMSLVAAATTSSGPALAVDYPSSSTAAGLTAVVSGGPVSLQGVGASCDSAPSNQPARLSAPLTFTVTLSGIPESAEGSNELTLYIGGYYSEHWYEAVSGATDGTYTRTIPVTGGGIPWDPSATLTCADAEVRPYNDGTGEVNTEVLVVKANIADWNAYVNRGYAEVMVPLTDVD